MERTQSPNRPFRPRPDGPFNPFIEALHRWKGSDGPTVRKVLQASAGRTDKAPMYGNVAGSGLVAAPAALALTGAGRGWIVVSTGLAIVVLTLGVAILRASQRSLFR